MWAHLIKFSFFHEEEFPDVGWGGPRGGGFGTRPWQWALLACGGAYWPLAFEPSAMTRRHPYYCGHPPAWGGGASRMHLLPMASSPDGLISARDAVITKTPGREVLTTTVWGGGGAGMSRWGVVLVCSGRRSLADRCPSLGPFPSIGGGAHRPLTALCPSSSSLACLSLSTSLSFPLGGCANGAGGGGGWSGRSSVQQRCLFGGQYCPPPPLLCAASGVQGAHWSRHATSVCQGNWFSVTINPVPKDHSVIPAPRTTGTQ